MPFGPLSAYASLQAILPPFCLKASREDLRHFIINGNIKRRFVLRGRFGELGHRRIMRSQEQMSAKAFLEDPIPRDSPVPRYNGDAGGCKGFLILWIFPNED